MISEPCVLDGMDEQEGEDDHEVRELLVLASLEEAMEKLGLATFELAESSFCDLAMQCNICIPFDMPHGDVSLLMSNFGLPGLQCRLLLLKLAITDNRPSCVTHRLVAERSLKYHFGMKTPLWMEIHSFDICNCAVMFPISYLRYTIQSLDAVHVWNHPKWLCAMANIPVQIQYVSYKHVPPDVKFYVCVWSDLCHTDVLHGPLMSHGNWVL